MVEHKYEFIQSSHVEEVNQDEYVLSIKGINKNKTQELDRGMWMNGNPAPNSVCRGCRIYVWGGITVIKGPHDTIVVDWQGTLYRT